MLTPAEPGSADDALRRSLCAGDLGLDARPIGFAVRHLAGHSPARRYLADASYWIYIVHLPIVLALQAAFAAATTGRGSRNIR